MAPCSLYVDGGKGNPCTLPVLQERNLKETGKPCPLVKPLPANINVIDLGERFLDETEPECVKADAWHLFTNGMVASERLAFASRLQFYRSLRLKHLQDERERELARKMGK